MTWHLNDVNSLLLRTGFINFWIFFGFVNHVLIKLFWRQSKHNRILRHLQNPSESVNRETCKFIVFTYKRGVLKFV